ncbi:putative alpha/beta hydrolase [Hypoxylon sp. NC1633]|nr:putative alpha/beta hydrolase [Hypoxylon sp. NC1633]
MPAQTVAVPHLNTKVGYALAKGKLDPAKPTVVLINALCLTVDAYAGQFASEKLNAAVNLLAIEPLGHGATTCDSEHFTYWDTAIVTLQAMQALGVSKAFTLGTSQGGWIVARMALLAPEKIQGLILLGTSMDSETPESRLKGCWDPTPFLTPFFQKWSSSEPTPDFVVGEDWIQPVIGLSLGSQATPEAMNFWTESMRRVYAGNEGRQKLRMDTICLAERDGLSYRLGDITCPVHWLHGKGEPVFSDAIAREQIGLFTASKNAKLDVLEGGCHCLNVSHPKEIEDAILAMVEGK